MAVPALCESGMRKNASWWPPIAAALEKRSVRLWRILAGPVCARSLLGYRQRISRPFDRVSIVVA